MARYISPVPQYFDAAGDPLALGKLFFFISGTNDPLATFADVNETIPNAQPVELTGDGRVPNIFFSGAAKVILTDQDEAQIWNKDPVTAGGDSGTIGDDWDAISIYQVNSVVDFSGALYVSIINNNQNNNPATSPEAWTQFDLLKRWNINEEYNIGDPVTADNGYVYTSLLNSNIGNDPSADDGANWDVTKGARVHFAASTVSVPSATPTILTWDTESYDRGGFHDNVVNSGRLTIPSGVRRVRLSTQVSWESSVASFRTVKIIRNAASNDHMASIINHGPSASASGQQGMYADTGIFDVIPGDFFQVEIEHNVGVPLDVFGIAVASTESRSWFTIEVIK